MVKTGSLDWGLSVCLGNLLIIVVIIFFLGGDRDGSGYFAGKLCIEVSSAARIAFISEELCIGCGICVKVRF